MRRRLLLIIVSIATASFLIGTLFSFTASAYYVENPFDKVWQAITGLQTKVSALQAEIEALRARIEALENKTPTATVQIKIEAYPTTDFYLRYHGLSIDEPLPYNFWLVEGYTFTVTGSAFNYTTTASLAHGAHYVEYASSGYAIEYNYAWHARIYINNVLTAEGEVGRDSPLRADFQV